MPPAGRRAHPWVPRKRSIWPVWSSHLYYSGVGYAHIGDLGPQASAEQQLRKTWEILPQP
jgi:hypothetical protein